MAKRKLEVRAPGTGLEFGETLGKWEKVGSGQVGALAQSWGVLREFLRLGADARAGKGAAHRTWGHRCKGEVGLEVGVGSRVSGQGKSLPVQQEGILVQGGEGD